LSLDALGNGPDTKDKIDILHFAHFILQFFTAHPGRSALREMNDTSDGRGNGEAPLEDTGTVGASDNIASDKDKKKVSSLFR
jgi:hypothetical protein